MRPVVGLDPSLTRTGIAVLDVYDRPTPVLRCVESTGKKGDDWETRYLRIASLTGRIVDAVPSGALVLIESPSYASASTSSHDRSGLWWRVYGRLSERGCQILTVAPSQRMKYATGKGNAPKDAVLAAAVRRYPGIDIKNNDEADAVVLLAMGLRLVGRAIDDLPKTHLAALDKIPYTPWRS